MARSEPELAALLGEARSMPYGAGQIALVEQVIEHAVSQGFEELAYRARMFGTDAYTFGGEPGKSFVTFSWCLAEYDRHPDRWAEHLHTLLWHFKHMISAMCGFPEIPLARTRQVLDDMERRYREGGHSLYAVYSCRHQLAAHVGDLDEAERWYQKWITSQRDELADCAGCDPTRKVNWLVQRGRYEEAVTIAEQVLAGQPGCVEQPQGILTAVMPAYLRTGRLDQARDAHRQAYRRHRPHLADLYDIGQHIWFCAVTGNEARGLELVTRHLAWLDEAPMPSSGMMFSAWSSLLLARVPDAVVHRPAYGDRKAADLRAGDLAGQLAEGARELAARLDARNGTNYQGGEVERTLSEAPIVPQLPLSPLAHRVVEPEPVAVPAPRADGDGLPDAEILDAKDPDELLDLAEAAYRRGATAEAYAAWQAFDDRYAAAELTVGQRARRADGYALEAANSGDLMSAEAAWTSAVGLYAEAGDELRRQTARGRLGLGRCLAGRGEEGLTMVEEATSYLLAHAPVDRRASAFVSLATAYRATGRAEEALANLDRAEEYAATSPDPHLGARLLVDRAQLCGALGRPEEARDAASAAIDLCRQTGFDEGLAVAYWLVGASAEQLGDVPAALANYDLSLAVCTDDRLRLQVRRQRAGLLAGSPRAAEAIGDLAEAVARFTADDEDDLANASRHQLAIAYLNSGRPLDAAEIAEEALAGFIAAEDQHQIAVRHLLATVYLRLGQPDEAITQLETIEETCLRDDNPAGAAQMAEEIGGILDREDRDALAANRFAAAAHRYRLADLPVDAVRSQRRQSTSLLWANNITAAVSSLADADLAALDLPAADPAAAWEQGMLSFDGARVLSHDDRPAEGAVRAAAAARRFRVISALVEAAHAEALRAELLLQADQPGIAEVAARQSLADLPPHDRHRDARKRMARLLVATLDAQDRPDEAAAVRDEHQLD